MLSDIKPDGRGTVKWVTSKSAKGGLTHISADSAVLKLSESKKISENFLGPEITALRGKEKAPPVWPGPFSEEAGCLFRGRLTKSVALALPEGAIVQSNTFRDKWTPVAVEPVGSLDSRDEFWKRLRSLGATNITCNVWQNLETYRRFAKRRQEERFQSA